jgi:small redox-active disulfide protein 2
MQIKVLGPGCARCEKLYKEAQQAIAEAGVEAELIKVSKLDEITAHGVAMTPGLIIDGEVKSVGKIPRSAQIADWIRQAASAPA